MNMQDMISQMASKLINNRKDQFHNFNTDISEMFIFTNPVSVVKAVYDHLSEINMLSDTDLELAIMTSIAIGGDDGAELEREFPHLKGANPKYSFA